MNPVQFDHVSFRYESQEPWVLRDLSLTIPPGITSLMGQNGSGKSTTLLLASGRLLPESGRVLLESQDTAALDEGTKNRLASLVYQNMEFETEESLGSLLEFVENQGFLEKKDGRLRLELVKAFELENLLKRKTQALSKGEMQRAVMAFALLYGSRVVVMDEPVFALEDRQKQACLDFITHYAKTSGRSFLFSIHEMELTQKFAENLMLFVKDGQPLIGPVAELFQRDILEKAYQVPWALLYQKERLFRETLLSTPSPSEIWKQNP